MKKVVVLILICLFFGCNKKANSEVQKPFIISEFYNQLKNYDKYYTDTKGRKIAVPPPPPSIPKGLIYGSNNFIIDKDSKIYYFQRNNEKGFRCGTGLENDTIAHFIDLQPKDLIEIPPNCIADFVILNHKKEVRNFTFISSQLDTLNSKNYFKLIKAIEMSLGNGDSYFIERTTQEEDTVLYYKKKDIFYDSKEIKWDKTRIKFPNQVKFSKP